MKNRVTVNIKKIILVIILILTTTGYHIKAQGPNAPEAGGFEAVDATDMVNLLTGDLTYVLPLLEIPSPEGGYPLTLSYHAGIAMDQEASWVGLGWNLNPGAINRGVNGFPDDWRYGRIRDRYYDSGESETETTVRVSYSGSGISIGTSMSFNSNKGFGGSVSLGVGFGSTSIGGTLGYNPGGGIYTNASIGLGLTGGFSIGGSVGTQGIGINSGVGGQFGNVGISYNRSFQGNNHYYASFGFGESLKRPGIGISFAGSGAASINGNINGVGAGANNEKQTSINTNDLSIETKSKGVFLPLPTPIGVFGIGYNKQSTRWALNSFQGFDVDGTVNYRNQLVRCEYSYIGNNGGIYTHYTNDVTYDMCTCEGLESLPGFDADCQDIISISPIPFAPNTMDAYEFSAIEGIKSPFNTNGLLPAYDSYDVQAQGLSGQMQPFLFENKTINAIRTDLSDLNGRFRLEYKSLLDPENSNNAFSKKSDFQFTNDLGTSLLITKTFFNQEEPFYIQSSDDGSHSGKRGSGRYVQYFLNNEIQNNQNSGLIVPADINFPEGTDYNIGAFMITSVDGKTYHYSQPVYNHETVRRLIDVNGKPEREAYYESIRPDPYATHWLLTAITGPDYIDLNNNNQVDEDDFGYWIDFQYGKWSDAFIWKTPYGKDYEVDGLSDKKEITYGRKQIYYLDKIKTRTHTAIFVKSLREDNYSNEWSYHSVENTNFPNPTTFDVPQFEVPIQLSLKLDKILLLKNDSDTIDKSFGDNLVSTGSVNILYSGQYFEKDEIASYNLQDNLIDINDNIQEAIESSIKIIDFSAHYNYLLAMNSPNSVNGRLTLNGVSFNGKGGDSYMPPYLFEYDNSRTYDVNSSDAWGYDKIKPETWSLDKIFSPSGSEIHINYEPDSFHKTAINNGKTINDGLKFTILGLPSCYQTGAISIKIEKELEDDYSPILDYDFLDLFTVNETAPFDFYEVAYRNVPGSSNIDWGIIDIPYQMGVITQVHNDYIIINLQGLVDCRSGSGSDISRLTQINPFSNIKSHSENWPYRNDLVRGDDPPYVPNGENYYTVKYTLISNKIRLNENGGGIRVKSLTTKDDTNNSITTVYDYNNPETGFSSGIISYYPYKENTEIQIPYGSELPNPIPMYEYVGKKNIIGDNISSDNYIFKELYKFNVLGEKDSNSTVFGNALGIESNLLFEEENGIFGDPSSAFEHIIEDNLSSLGLLLERTSYNSQNQIINKTINEYASKNEITQGIIQESFRSFKQYSWWSPSQVTYTSNKVNISSSTKKMYPSVLKSTITKEGNVTSKTYFGSHDPITGQLLETTTISSDGTKFKTKSVPAYTLPEYNPIGGYGMGSKVDDITNKNMLTQEAASFTYLIDDTDQERMVNASINTWNNEWDYYNSGGTLETAPPVSQKIWRKHKNYIWKGSINNDGTYSNYTGEYDGFDWNIDASQPEQWQMISQTTQYDHYSMPLESMDINGNYASTHMGDDNSKIIATSNAAFGEGLYTGLEYDSQSGYYSDDQILGRTKRTSEKAHTGSYSAMITPGENTYQNSFGAILRANRHREGKYKLSVWVHKDNYENAGVKYSYTATPIAFNGEKVFAGDWVQLNHYFDRSASQTQINGLLLIGSLSGTVYADDYRIHPIQSSMSSYVYNEWDELTHIIGANNMATQYEYDEGGRLKRTYVEVADTPTVEGGFKLAAEYNQHYKREISSESNDDDGNGLEVYFGNIQNDNGSGETTFTLYGPPNLTVTLTLDISGYSDSYNYEASVSLLNGGGGTNVDYINSCVFDPNLHCGPRSFTTTIPANGEQDGTLTFWKATNGLPFYQCAGSTSLTISFVPSPGVVGTSSVISDIDTTCTGVGGDDDDPNTITGNIHANGISCGNSGLPDDTRGIRSHMSGVSGGSGNYNYTWEYRTNSGAYTNWTSTGLSYNAGGTSATLTFDPSESVFCIPSNLGPIQFRCIISDADDATVQSETFTTGTFPINCESCGTGGDPEH